MPADPQRRGAASGLVEEEVAGVRGRHRELTGLLLAATTLATMLTACGASPSVHAPSAACAGASCAAGPGTRAVQVFVEPDARAAPITAALAGATSSIWMEVYLLTDTSVIQALEDAAARGVEVRVLLEPAPFGEGSVAPQTTLERLNAAGVQARTADPTYHYTHAKTMLIDHATAYIMTCNLTHSGLGGTAQATNREYGAIDTDPADVAELAAIFQADWGRTATPALPDPNLVVSPINARPRLLDLLGAARTSLAIEDEEMLDPRSEDALIAAARRGVAVEIVLPAPSAGAPPSTDVPRLVAGGVRVRYSATLYMHAKLIVVDGQRAFIGSENFSPTSLDANREVGVVLAAPVALATLSAAFGADWSTGVPFAG